MSHLWIFPVCAPFDKSTVVSPLAAGSAFANNLSGSLSQELPDLEDQQESADIEDGGKSKCPDKL